MYYIVINIFCDISFNNNVLTITHCRIKQCHQESIVNIWRKPITITLFNTKPKLFHICEISIKITNYSRL